MTDSADLVGRLEQDVSQLTQMVKAAALCGAETGVRVKSPDALLQDLREAAASIARLTEDLARTERNRDMWKGQCERQAARLTELTASESKLREIEAETREACAVKADAWSRPDVVRLAAGEMTAQELRTAQAVARGIAAAIRSQASQGESK